MSQTAESTPLPKLEDLKVISEPTVTISPAPITPSITLSVKLESLRPQLSSKATINFLIDANFKAHTDRWSTFGAPTSGAVVNVATEEDIVATIKWALTNTTKLAARSGGHGWTSTLSQLGPESIVINLRALNSVNIDLPNGTATLGAGVITQEVVEAAHAADTHIMTGVCNTVGVVSVLLGGGIGNLISLYGIGVDNMLSARLITAKGELVTVSADENSDLWWGLRGAGHNFGIVTQLTVKAHKQVNGGVHWAGTLGFPGSKKIVEKVCGAINELGFGEGKPMACTVVWARVPPTFEPFLMVNVWYGGVSEAGQAAFAPLLSLNPVMNTTGPAPYTSINAPSDFACVKNGHKRPCYGVATSSLSPTIMSALFTDWVNFTAENQDAAASVVLTECYDLKKAREVDGTQTAFPWRKKNFHLMLATDFTDVGLEGKVKGFGDRFRGALREEGLQRSVYVNFATGDEEPEMLYGGKERLDRLRGLKEKWDPEGVFSYYNPFK